MAQQAFGDRAQGEAGEVAAPPPATAHHHEVDARVALVAQQGLRRVPGQLLRPRHHVGLSRHSLAHRPQIRRRGLRLPGHEVLVESARQVDRPERRFELLRHVDHAHEVEGSPGCRSQPLGSRERPLRQIRPIQRHHNVVDHVCHPFRRKTHCLVRRVDPVGLPIGGVRCTDHGSWRRDWICICPYSRL
jgi:hypothetical protein